ncbi:MAG TPA: tetratricopeptide repeat protein [Spirochaetia bacterium]|nr:tetratricopeptide repeat protein [Spirochaetia bacterium]
MRRRSANPLRWAATLAVTGTLCLAALGPSAPAAWSADTPAAKGLEPAFPVENQNLSFTEAEDAVSTNFAREPVLNFGVSGFRALQLNQGSGLQGVGSFYADYVVSLPSTGTWELWYGGSPPGPKDDLYASYASPLTVVVDSGTPLPVTRETVAVVGNYSPSFYWNRVGDLSLSEGRHTIRFAVTEKRRADGRYVFYLDCFFLVRKDGDKRLLDGPLPSVFPSNLDDRSIDTPFLSLDDALIRVRDNPSSVAPLVYVSGLYTMLGDYLNALKYLNRAALLEPSNSNVLVLIAKNRIWKGDIPEGLTAYRTVLNRDPKQRELWLEAGKVAAWNGQYDQSIGFYRDALAAFPGDLDATVNLGLTYLWAGRGDDAEASFREAQRIAGSDPDRLKELGRIYRISGYPDRALQAYSAAQSAAPQDLESYLLAIDTLLAAGRKAEADLLRKRIMDTFAPSDRLSTYLDSFQQRAGLKDQILAEDEDRLKNNPDDLVLRQILAQSYFWNGLKDKAIAEYRHILANYAYHALTDSQNQNSELLLVIDRSYLLADYFNRVPAMIRAQRDSLGAQSGKLAQAQAARDRARTELASAQTAQSKAKAGKDADAAQTAVTAAQGKLQAAEDAVQKETDALGQAAASAAGLVAHLQKLSLGVIADTGTTGALSQQDKEAEAAFARSIQANHWRYDRGSWQAELAQDTGSNDLARLVSARVSLADRMVSQARATMAVDIGTRQATTAAYTLVQSSLWAGKIADASHQIEQLSGDPGSSLLPRYFPEIVSLDQTLSAPVPPARADADPPNPATVASQLGSLLQTVSNQRGQLQRNLSLLHTLYRHSVIRADYAFEQAVSSIRNELGDYYLAGDPPALDAAIGQFRRVLSVDPGNLDATFRLAKVYEWKQDWKSALDAYKAVYTADPGYENVSGLYNRLSRLHASTLSSQAYALADTQHVQWHSEADWSTPFDSALGFDLTYQTDAMRIQRANVTGGTDASSYQVQDLSMGLPIDLYLANVKLTPWVGGQLVGDSLYQKTGSVVPTDNQFETITAALPYARLDASVGAWNALFLSGTLRWGVEPETLDPSRGAQAWDGSAEANLSTQLSFLNAWPFRDTSLRTYARVDYIPAGPQVHENLMYTALQEVTINLLKGGSPYGVVSLTGNVTFQHADYLEPYLYWAPPDVLLAGASLTGSEWIGAPNGDVLGLSLRVYGGSYQQSIFTAPTHELKAELEADITLTTGSSTWSLAILGNGTYNFALAGTPNPWDYWSGYARLGYSVSLPDLLAP